MAFLTVDTTNKASRRFTSRTRVRDYFAYPKAWVGFTASRWLGRRSRQDANEPKGSAWIRKVTYSLPLCSGTTPTHNFTYTYL